LCFVGFFGFNFVNSKIYAYRSSTCTGSATSSSSTTLLGGTI